ncbi:MAG: hypothetical protein ACUVWX_08510 [Kiritimatiellia bacterium]
MSWAVWGVGRAWLAVTLGGLLFAAANSICVSQELTVTEIKAFHRYGQTFVTWKDVVPGEEGSRYRYLLYRSDHPITQETLDKAELCYHGVLNNSCKQIGYAFGMKDRLDPAKPTYILEEGGQPLPM